MIVPFVLQLLFSIQVAHGGSIATVLWDSALLEQTKQLLNSPATRASLQPALDNLTGWADHWYSEAEANRTFSVMTKPTLPPSGNRKHFMSVATYWWPSASHCADRQNATVDDPACWPWEDHDGLVNPTTFAYDSLTISQMILAVKNLTLACYFTGNVSYGHAALRFIDAWFLNPVSGMDPHQGLEFGQIIPGLKDGVAGPSYLGRCFGVIDAKDIVYVLDGLLLIQGMQVSGADVVLHSLRQWFQSYNVWLSGSRHAIAEYGRTNNHGTWYDVQALSVAIHLENASAIANLSHDALARVAFQIQPNGTMPAELARTRSMHYTWWALQALFELSFLAEHGDVDVWHYKTADGRSLRAALDFVLPYVVCERPWPHQEVSPFDHGKFFYILRLASLKWKNASYEAAIPHLNCAKGSNVQYKSSVQNLLWPSQPAADMAADTLLV